MIVFFQTKKKPDTQKIKLQQAYLYAEKNLYFVLHSHSLMNIFSKERITIQFGKFACLNAGLAVGHKCQWKFGHFLKLIWQT
jgi:hypothetical protein